MFLLGILLQQQEKLKQKIHEEQQQQQQQHSIVPLTPESVARFLANQTQSQTSDHHHPWPIHHSISAPTFMNNNYYDTCQTVRKKKFYKKTNSFLFDFFRQVQKQN